MALRMFFHSLKQGAQQLFQCLEASSISTCQGFQDIFLRYWGKSKSYEKHLLELYSIQRQRNESIAKTSGASQVCLQEGEDFCQELALYEEHQHYEEKTLAFSFRPKWLSAENKINLLTYNLKLRSQTMKEFSLFKEFYISKMFKKRRQPKICLTNFMI